MVCVCVYDCSLNHLPLSISRQTHTRMKKRKRGTYRIEISISNLNFISKILEKVVASRIQSHLLSNSLSSSFQSAYRMFHSTETTLLSIHNDLILAMDRGEVTSLILLDLSAAFDTVDHSILLHRLQHWFGLHGTSLDWFSSYLTSRS